MKWYITRKRMLAIIIVLFLAAVAMGLWGCTAREEANARAAGAAAATVMGLPPVVGNSLVGLAIAITHVLTAKVSHSRGRRKERACHVPRTTPPQPARDNP